MERAGLGLAGCALLGRGTALAQPPPGGPLEGREPRDPNDLTPEERAHAPVLVMPRAVRAGRPFDLVVQIGVEPHPMERGHRIEWVEVHAGEERVFASTLGPAVAFPIVRVPIVLSAPTVLTVRARCNRHDVWRTRREILLR